MKKIAILIGHGDPGGSLAAAHVMSRIKTLHLEHEVEVEVVSSSHVDPSTKYLQDPPLAPIMSVRDTVFLPKDNQPFYAGVYTRGKRKRKH